MGQGNARELAELVVESFGERGIVLVERDSRSEDFDNVMKSALRLLESFGDAPEAFRKELKKERRNMKCTLGSILSMMK